MTLEACIVRDRGSAERALVRNPEAVLLCADEATLAFCLERRADAVLLDEDTIREEHRPLTVWGFRNAVECTERHFDDEKEGHFFQSNFALLQRLFVQPLKMALVLRKILDERRVGRLTIEDDGASFLAIVSEEYIRRFHPAVEFCRLSPATRPAQKTGIDAKQALVSLFAAAAALIGEVKLRTALRKKEKLILASGAINHLEPVLAELQQRHSFRTVYVENAFNLEKFNFCRKNGMIFWVVPRPSAPYMPSTSSIEALAGGKRPCVYKGMDCTEWFAAVFKRYFALGQANFHYDYGRLTDLMARCGFERMLLDEDLAIRRMFGSLFGWKHFVVSHGMPGALLDDSGRDLLGRYRSGTVFAGGEFEKKEYEKLYYDGARVVTPGIPRYDRIFHVRRRASESGVSGIKTVLYCGASLKPFHFEDMYTLLGLKTYFGGFTERYLKDLLGLLGGKRDVRLDIKPHYHDEAVWQACIDKAGSGGNYRLLSHKDDTFELESRADLVVTVESSVISESILFGKPVIVLNYAPEKLWSDYETHPLIEHVRNKAELERAIQRCLYDGEYLKELSIRREKFLEYYAAYSDGKNAIRAAEIVAGARETGPVRTQRPAYV